MRITPAHAGKRNSLSNCHIQCRDHPRPCGEKAAQNPLSFLASGSPPPMRGKDSLARIHVGTSRITPAHAGKRTTKSSLARLR